MSMSTAEIVIKATFKFLVIWTGLAAVGLPIAKLGIEVAYEIWRDRV
ncbi:Uncharacterised protein [uncultured Clostridium sp.]|nr:hypothetical protein [uncultured Clostridium sp.]SCJ98979.1 Uncharacterised protein [uncultured Clostridium sp.]